MRFVIKTRRKKNVDGVFAFNYDEANRYRNEYVNLEFEKTPSVGLAANLNQVGWN